ncbi:MAG TPA: ribonuclease activity regulator RraA [Candidatus Limnocylindrales bacterium]
MGEVPDAVLAQLRECSTATLTTQLMRRGLRNTFLAGLRPLNPAKARFAGPAFTLRYIPSREDIDVPEVFQDRNHPQRVAIEATPPGHVLIMDSRQEPRAASAGEILVTRLQQRGVAAVVTDGSFRDSPGIAATLDIPAFAAGMSAMTNLALHHAVDMNVPIGCAGVPVYPGDIVVGDAEGVVVIPRHLAAEVAADALPQERLEEFLRQRIADGAPLFGTYPPDEQTLADYRSSNG